MGALVYFCFFAGCISLYILFSIAKTRTRKVLLVNFFLIYLFGFIIAIDEVSAACMYSTCKHGWYSKYNTFEKFMAFLWTLTPCLFFTKQIGAIIKDISEENETET